MVKPITLLFLFMGASSVLFGAEPARIHVDIDHGYPMSEIARQIEHVTGVPISYEDAPAEDSADLKDVSLGLVSPEYLKQHPNAKVFVVKEVRVTGDIEIPKGKSPRAEAISALESAQKLPQLANHRTKFEVIKAGYGLVLVPVQRRDKSGVMRSADHPFDTIISYKSQDGASLFQTLDGILHELSSVLGIKIGLGDTPVNILAQMHTKIDATGVTARSLISMAFMNAETASGESGLAFTWNLVDWPGMQTYLMHVEIATKSMPAPFGGMVQTPILQKDLQSPMQ